jgi:CopG antitoxin of type II toxin-antitoxin system
MSTPEKPRFNSGSIMNPKLLPIQEFSGEEEERKFWETHDSTLYFDHSLSQRVRFPNLKPSKPKN